MKIINSILLIVFLNACQSTVENPSSSLPSSRLPSNSVEREQLEKKIAQYPKDTVSLNLLTAMQSKEYQKTGNLTLLNKAIASFNELIKRQPFNDNAVFQLYRLNILKGFLTGTYDISHWQNFYQQYPYLQSIDIAPPEYMKVLLSSKDSLSDDELIDILQNTLLVNPNFINAYIKLADIYVEKNKPRLALFTLESAVKHSPNNMDVLGLLNVLRMDRISDKHCQLDTSTSLNKAFTDYKKLVKAFPDDAYNHMQLSNVLLFMGRSQMSLFSIRKAAALSKEYQIDLLHAQFSSNTKALAKYFQNKTLHTLNAEELYLYMLLNLVNFNWSETANLVEEYIKHEDITFYGILYGAYAYKILGQEHMAENIINQGLSKIKIKPWQQEMLNFAQNKTSSEKLVAISANNCELTEAYFIQSLKQIHLGEMTEAQKNMEKILELNIYPFTEYSIAKNIIKRLNTN